MVYGLPQIGKDRGSWAQKLNASIQAVKDDTDDAVGKADTAIAGLATKFDSADIATIDYTRRGPRVIGDWTNSLGVNGTVSSYNAAEGAVSLGGLSYFAYALPLTQGKFRYGGNIGHVGWTSTQLLEDYLAAVLASDWDYVHLQFPTNDMGAGIPIATTKANVIAACDALLAAGKTPMLSTIPPLGTAVTGNTGTKLAFITKYNLWVKRYATSHNLPFTDYHSATVNPADNTHIAGSWNADGVHPVSAGARNMGLALAATLNAIPNLPKSALWASYNPNLMQPDCCFTSAGSDKWNSSGSTSGGWHYKLATSPQFRGNSQVFTRGSAGDYSATGAISPSAWVAGHRVRVSFGLDASNVPSGGSWSAYLYNFTQSQVICGFAGMPFAMTNRSLTVTGATVTSGSKTITAPAGTFKPAMVGCGVAASVGVSFSLTGGIVDGVSPDGTTLYSSIAATVTQTGTACVTVTGEPCISVWEFTVQPEMVGDDIRMAYAVAGAAGTTLGLSQVTVQDLTTLEVI